MSSTAGAWPRPAAASLAQDRPRAGLVQPLGEDEAARLAIGAGETRDLAAAEPRDRPAGHRPGELGDVGLGIDGADAQRVQLHDLAREILVEPEAAFARRRCRFRASCPATLFGPTDCA
jgi:hypothetical protein